MTREAILKNRLDMALHNLMCYSSNLLMNEPKEGFEAEHTEALEEVGMLNNWLKEFDPCHNPVKCTANIAIAILNVIDESILKMAGGAIADEDMGMYLRAYSNDIRGVIQNLKKIGE